MFRKYSQLLITYLIINLFNYQLICYQLINSHFLNLNYLMLERLMQNLIAVNPPAKSKATRIPFNYSRESTKQYLPDLFIQNNPRPEPSQFCLQVSIWETDSTREMFDFENKSMKVKEHQISGTHDVYMMNSEARNARCCIVKEGVFNENLYCGKVEANNGYFSYLAGGQADAYRVVGKQKCILEVGSRIRVGRMHYFVKEIFDGKTTKFKEFHRQKVKSQKIASLKSGTCKFCLCDEADNPDILISPCSCKGSCAQVHIQCLKQWLVNKVTRKSTQLVQYLNYDSFNCEICKDELPTTFEANNIIYSMLSQSQFDHSEPYLTLEGIPNEKSSTSNNLTIKIRFPLSKQELVIGRGHEADIRLEDVSISRQHCLLNFSENRFYIADNQSKFGTLIKCSPNERVDLKKSKVQIGRMILCCGKDGANKKCLERYSLPCKPNDKFRIYR